MTSRPNISFDAVKYRSKLRRAATHAHLQLDSETGRFLFSMASQKSFEKPLYDSFLRAQYSKSAVYELPFTVAEPLAQRHRIKRADFLRRIVPQMTTAEKQRMQNSASRSGRKAPPLDLSRTPLTKLALYVLSLPLAERRAQMTELHAALVQSAQRALVRSPLQLGRVAAVLDRSRSTWGSRERRRRPLAVAVAAHYLLSAACADFRPFWTGGLPRRIDPSGTLADKFPFLHEAGGQTDLAGPLLDALEWRPSQVILISDGYENSPPDGVEQVVRVFRARIEGAERTSFIHANPVFDPQHFAPRRLGDSILTVGLRDAEDLSTALGFARFAGGDATQAELEAYLGGLAEKLINDEASRSA